MAPDSREPFAYGKDFVVEPCPTPVPEQPQQPQQEPPQEQELTEPGTETGPQPAPSPSPHGDPPDDTSGAAPAPLRVTVPRLRAATLRRGRSFRVAVEPGAPVTGLVVTLTRRRVVLARGRRASVDRASTVNVEAIRRIRRGTYTLVVRARTQSGESFRRAYVVRVR